MDKFLSLKASSEGSNMFSNVFKSKNNYGGLDGMGLTAQTDDNVLYKSNGDDQEDMFDNTMRLPVKNHLGKLEDQLGELKQDLEDTTKTLQMARSDMIGLEHSNKDVGSELSKYVMEELIRIEKDFKKLGGIEKSESTFLRQQMHQLNQDKIKLQQNCLILESRVQETESDVGFKGLVDYR